MSILIWTRVAAGSFVNVGCTGIVSEHYVVETPVILTVNVTAGTTEHDEMFAAIRSGKPINNGDYMSKSTMVAIMGRMSAYTGKTVTWKQAMESTEDLTPNKYDWTDLEMPEVAMPGITPFA